MKKRLIVLVCILGLVASTNATVLTFDNADSTLAGGYGLIPDGYGDNVAGASGWIWLWCWLLRLDTGRCRFLRAIVMGLGLWLWRYGERYVSFHSIV